MLNYNNFTDTVEEDFLPAKANQPGKLQLLTKQMLLDTLAKKEFSKVISEDMKLYANDIIFSKKK
jgi:hypothetical protein